MPPLIVLPARWGSRRFPGKMLHPIGGRPLIAWTVEAALAYEGAAVVVATDDERIAEAAKAAGAEVEMTAADLASGTDRVAAAARRRGWEGDVLNWQGDEPTLSATDAAAAVGLLDRFEIGTLAAPFRGDLADPHRVKVSIGPGGRASGFSRRAFPSRRRGESPPLEHVGIYACRAPALAAWVAAEATPRERAEGLEQLRAMDLGLTIGVAEIPEAPVGVNVPGDVARVAERLGVTAS